MKKKLIFCLIRFLTRLHILTPIRVAKLRFFYVLGRWPDFENPKDLNEKINWMKFYGDTSMWSLLADKYAVREYVRSKGLGDLLIPLIGKWDSVEEIDWDTLPNQFVMKCNNGTGDVLICKDKTKLDIEKTKEHFNKHLKKKLSIFTGEPHYAKIKPCIIAEQLLDSSRQPCSSSLIDYKVWVFGGETAFIRVYTNRRGYFADVMSYDTDWKPHPEWSVFTEHYHRQEKLVPRPRCLEQMLEVAQRLSEGQPFARIDLYEVDGKVYFGEITMTSSAGYMNNFTKDMLRWMGDKVQLPIHKS